MLNNYKKPLGSDDLFNKQKLAEEARREAIKIKEVEKQKVKNQLQLKINNLKHELEIIKSDLKNKESKLFSTKRDALAFSRELILEKNKIQKEIGLINSFVTQKNSTSLGNFKLKLNKTTLEIDSIRKIGASLDLDYRKNKTELDNLNKKLISLQNEINAITNSIQHIKNEILELDRKINENKTEQNRLEIEFKKIDTEEKQSQQTKINKEKESDKKITEIEQLKTKTTIQERKFTKAEEDKKTIEEDINRTKSEISQKENEIERLIREMNQI
jgi:chromosome segregation ATPase